MIICDLTHAYTATSGGIRTYLEAKRKYILENTEHTHVLIVPSEEDRVILDDRALTYHVKGAPIPGAAPYRCFLRRSDIVDILRHIKPNVVELNTYYMPPEAAAAFKYRTWAEEHGHRCIVGIHYHTDFANAYVKHYTVGLLGETISTGLERLAQRYVRRILLKSDFNLTFSNAHLQRIQSLGIRNTELVPQFVDLDTFHPSRNSPPLRESLGIAEEDMLLIYAGRFDTEKHVHTLVDALELLPNRPAAHLVMIGNGPLLEELTQRASTLPNCTLVPYKEDKAEIAKLLATADIYVTAGPHEVAAFSVVEAQASGLPCVGVDAGGLRGRVHDGLGFLGPVDNANAMATNILKARTLQDRLSQAARDHAEQHYGHHRSFSTILRNYEARVNSTNVSFASSPT